MAVIDNPLVAPLLDEQVAAIAGAFQHLESQVIFPPIAAFFLSPARSVTQTVELPRNALVDRFVVTVGASPASSLAAGAAGQFRTENLDGGRKRAIIDFGQMRTVSRVSVSGGVSIEQAYPWQGTKFGTYVFYGSASNALFTSEVRTERLMLDLGPPEAGSFPADKDLAATMTLRFTDGATDLEITVNGTSAWTHAGPVNPAPDQSEPVEGKWSTGFQQKVDITSVLASLTGDPTAAETPESFEVVLTSTTAAYLTVTVPGAGDDRRVRRVRRQVFEDGAQTRLDFAEEGERTLALSLPDATARTIETLTLSAIAESPPLRVLPAVGPDESDLLELRADADHALCLRLPATTGLAELTGVRLRLRVDEGGAEARVALWGNVAGGTGPDALVPDALSEPVALDPSAEGVPGWTTFAFPEPVPLDPDDANRPWASILVSRGGVTLRPATGDAGALSESIRRGAEQGPWLPLSTLR